MEYDVEIEERIRYIEDMVKLENDRVASMEEAHEKRTKIVNKVLTTLIVILSIVTTAVVVKELL